ncbi:hypothetical protein A1O1_01701 [Capronia coronata CBS 617.96]|uniref:HOOK N-terminal domain-containing protein n=1 Tax=Capronia coronata CBS 617.96 TaxID=1182541 RepID=W9ZFL7_9EURO|nr:uncharacterized protein A1O1_01701 [Capronia coronata CBS 617.96]EXJ93309.1 hypothetical protein A1O1_01701 [Capronia coronata CBS 617.96]
MATDEAVAAGLIDWVNSLAVADPVYTVDDFTNGQIIWKVLQQIDRFSFPGKLPEDPNTDQWIHKWTNLKHIYDALSIFLVEECRQRLPFPGGRPDLKAIAQSSSLSDSVALLKLLVVAAINCADRIEYLKQMQDLSESTQQVLIQTVQEAGEDEGGEAEEPIPDELVATEELPVSPRQSGEVDSVLESEERLGKVIADNQRIAHEKRELQKQLDESHSRYEKLQGRFDQLQDELMEANDRLASLLAGRSDVSTRALDPKHDAIIATLENRVLETESEADDLRKANELLKIKAEKAQKLQDDYDEIKIERDRLARKANTAEKYRLKLEASQDLEKDNNNLRTKVTELQNQLKQFDSARASSSDLQREIDEYRRLLPSIEQERYELNEMKKRLEFDYHALEARYHDTLEQLSRQDRAVEDLQGRLRDYEDGMPPAETEEKHPEVVDTDFALEEAELLESEARLTAALLNVDDIPTHGRDSDDAVANDDALSPSATQPDQGADRETISETELKAIMSAMRSQAQVGTATQRESSLRAQRKLVVAIERQRTKNRTLLESLQKQDLMITEMRERLREGNRHTQDDAQSIPPPPPPEDAPPSSIESHLNGGDSEIDVLRDENTLLQRELNLMASAWYDQNLRLASASSSTAGRNRGLGPGAEPQGFLGRQRRKIDAAAFGRPS